MSKYITPATLLCDFYKVSHRDQYPEGTEKVYSTWTPRGTRIPGIDAVIAFGFQAFIKGYLMDYFDENFFGRPKEDIVAEFTRVIKYTMGVDSPTTSHIEALHDLGYLPLRIFAVPEGTAVPIRIPMLTIENTLPEFFWLTNYIETLMSMYLWMPSTSATIAKKYKSIMTHYAKLTGGDESFVPFQGHDFSMRGMTSLESAKGSGAGHLLSFVGTDSIPAILYLEEFYNANIENELVGTSLPATEHSVMCTYGQDEMASYHNLITNVYPNGFVSIVSDTWDYWKVLDEVIKPLKKHIMARDGKVVIRPDSGDPVKIICGDPYDEDPRARKGTVEILWDIFGGTVTEQGYKVLDPHIGTIYGDAITLVRCEEISKQLMDKGFASTNVVYGIGSYTYQYNTRDTFGFALKSTQAIINGKEVPIFKDPKTDDGLKKSQKGMVVVAQWTEDSDFTLIQELNEEGRNALTENEINIMRKIYEDGELLVDDSLADIRERMNV